MARTIDVTPTRREILPVLLLAAAANGSQPAIDELYRLADIADKGNAA